MNLNILVTCKNCDYFHSNICHLGMRKKRTIGKGKNGRGKYFVCRLFSVWFKQPYKDMVQQ